MPSTKPWEAYRFVFIGGLHRSGTSYTARALAKDAAISAFKGTGAPEDEGEHLQSVFADSWEFGGVGRFAFAPEMHLNEESAIVSDVSRATLWDEWSPLWDLGQPTLLEKSPPNMLRMRLLQALFPQSGQILVIRHPVSVVLSSLRWRTAIKGMFDAHRIIDHWLRANAIALSDAPHIRSFYLLRYENLIAEEASEMERISHQLMLPLKLATAKADPSRNERNFDTWKRLTQDSPRREYFRWIERRYESRIARFGYSFASLGWVSAAHQ